MLWSLGSAVAWPAWLGPFILGWGWSPTIETLPRGQPLASIPGESCARDPEHCPTCPASPPVTEGGLGLVCRECSQGCVQDEQPPKLVCKRRCEGQSLGKKALQVHQHRALLSVEETLV